MGWRTEDYELNRPGGTFLWVLAMAVSFDKDAESSVAAILSETEGGVEDSPASRTRSRKGNSEVSGDSQRDSRGSAAGNGRVTRRLDYSGGSDGGSGIKKKQVSPSKGAQSPQKGSRVSDKSPKKKSPRKQQRGGQMSKVKEAVNPLMDSDDEEKSERGERQKRGRDEEEEEGMVEGDNVRAIVEATVNSIRNRSAQRQAEINSQYSRIDLGEDNVPFLPDFVIPDKMRKPFGEVLLNSQHLHPIEGFMNNPGPLMQTVSKNWAVVNGNYLALDLNHRQPGIVPTLIEEYNSPVFPPIFDEWMFVIAAILKNPEMNGYIVQTPTTRLVWNKKSIVGVQKIVSKHQDRALMEAYMDQSTLPRSRKIGKFTMKSMNEIMADEIKAQEGDSLYNVPAISPYVGVTPVEVVLEVDRKTGKPSKTARKLFWTLQTVCIEGFDFEGAVRAATDVSVRKTAEEREMCREVKDTFNKCLAHQLYSSLRYKNTGDNSGKKATDYLSGQRGVAHPYFVLSPYQIFNVINESVAASHPDCLDILIHNLPNMSDDDDYRRMREHNTAYLHACYEWKDEFEKAKKKLELALLAKKPKTGDNGAAGGEVEDEMSKQELASAYELEFQLPVIPLIHYNALKDPEKGTMVKYFSYLEAPLMMRYHSMRELPALFSVSDFSIGQLPHMALFVLMDFIFDFSSEFKVDLSVFMGPERICANAEQIRKSFYLSEADEAIKAMIKPGTFQYLEQSFWENVYQQRRKITDVIDDCDSASNLGEPLSQDSPEGTDIKMEDESDSSQVKYLTVRSAVYMRLNYLQSVLMFQKTLIDSGAFKSLAVKNAHVIINTYEPFLCNFCRVFFDRFGLNEDEEQRNFWFYGNPYMMAQETMIQSSVGINAHFKMNALNLIAQNLFITFTMGWFFGNMNKFWRLIGVSMQIMSMQGHLKTRNSKTSEWSMYPGKHNSSGADQMVKRNSDIEATNFKDVLQTSSDMHQKCVQITRATMKAWENLGKVSVMEGKIAEDITEEERGCLYVQTEQGDVDLYELLMKCQILPRDSGTEEKRALTTELNEKKQRRNMKTVTVEYPNLVAAATNGFCEDRKKNERWVSLLNVVTAVCAGSVCMKPELAPKGANDQTPPFAMGDSELPSDKDERILFSAGRTVAVKIIQRYIASMHNTGMIGIEPSRTVKFVLRSMQLFMRQNFLCLVHPNMQIPFSRKIDSHTTHGVIDSMQESLVYHLAVAETMDEAIVQTMMRQSTNALPLSKTPSVAHCFLREILDQRVFMIADIVQAELKVPVVHPIWLFQVLGMEDGEQCDVSSGYGKEIHDWLKLMMIIPDVADEPTENRGDDFCRYNVIPERDVPLSCDSAGMYISTLGNSNNSPEIMPDTHLRVRHSEGGTKGGIALVAEKIIRTLGYATIAKNNAGVPDTSDVWIDMLSAFCNLKFDFKFITRGRHWFNMAIAMKRFHLENMCPRNYYSQAMKEGFSTHSPSLGVIQLLSHGGDNKVTCLGVHPIMMLVLTSISRYNTTSFMHPNAGAVAASNLLSVMYCHYPHSVLPGDGERALLKCYYDSDSHVQARRLQVQRKHLASLNVDTYYIPRHIHDFAPFAKGAEPKCIFGNYLQEDVLHLCDLDMLSQYDTQVYTEIPAEAFYTINAELLVDKPYPLVGEGALESCVQGSIILLNDGDFVFSLQQPVNAAEGGGYERDKESGSIVFKKFLGKTIKEKINLSQILRAHNVKVFPCINRPNAVVYDENLGFGHIVKGANGHFYNFDNQSYKVCFMGSEQQPEMDLHFKKVHEMLVAVHTQVVVSVDCLSNLNVKAGSLGQKTHVLAVIRYSENYGSGYEDGVFVAIQTERLVNGQKMKRCELVHVLADKLMMIGDYKIQFPERKFAMKLQLVETSAL